MEETDTKGVDKICFLCKFLSCKGRRQGGKGGTVYREQV